MKYCNVCKRRRLFLSLNKEGICKNCEKRIADEAAEARRLEIERIHIENWNAAEEFYSRIEKALKHDPFSISHCGMSTDVIKRRLEACDTIKNYADDWKKYHLFKKVFYSHCKINKRTNALDNPLFHAYGITEYRSVNFSDLFSKLKQEADKYWIKHYLALMDEYVDLNIEDSSEYQDILYKLYYGASPFVRKPSIILEMDYLDGYIKVFANSHRVGSIYNSEIIKRWSEFQRVENWGILGSIGSFSLFVKAVFRRSLC